MLASPALAALTILPFLLGPTEHPPERWAPGVRTEWSLAPGEVRRHVVSLQPGEFVRVTVVESGIDVSLRVHGPDGMPGREVDFTDWTHGWELSSILASKAGEHVLEVKARSDARGPGHYVLDSDPVRIPGPADHRRLVAEDARVRSGPGLGRQSADLKTDPPPRDAAEEAERQLPIAEAIFHELGETCLEAESLTSRALLSGWAHRIAQALDLHARAMVLWEGCDDVHKRAQAHVFAAEGYTRAGQYARAAAIYEQGLALARAIGAAELELMLLTNLGGTYVAIGDTEGAIQRLGEVLPLLRAANVKQGEAVALRSLARTHIRRGDYELAADRASESLVLRREIGDWLGEASTLITLGEVYLKLGEPAVARQHFEEALATLDRKYGGDHRGWPHLLTGLAKAYEEVGDSDRALAALEKSLEYNQRADLREVEPDSLLELGRFYARRRIYEPAWEAGGEAARLFRGTDERHALAGALELQGEAALGLGEAARAAAPLEEALRLRRVVQDLPGEAAALHLLARVDVAGGDPHSARRRLEEALRLVESTRARIVSPDFRSAWLAGVRGIHETYVETLMELHRRDPGAGLNVRAFEASDAARARSLLDRLAEAGASIRQGIDPELLARERSLRERLGASLERQLGALRKEGASVPDDLAAEIHSLSTEYEEVRGRIRAISPRYAALTQPERLSLDQVREQVLDADTLLLEFGLGEERSYLWIVAQDLFVTFELPGKGVIEAAVHRARDAINRRPDGPVPQAALEALSRMLLGGAWKHLADRRLLFVADGPLHHVPFAALLDGAGRPLVARHEVVYGPSASALALLRRTAAARPRPKRALTVLADPVFDAGDARVGSARPVAGLHRESIERATRAFGFEGGRLPRLSFTRQEAKSILALAPVGSRRLALDFEASRTTPNDPELKDYRIVHVATHGLLNDIRPELSGLVLSLIDRQGREVPGLLTAPDIFNLELEAELVVLSGCRTALGKEIRGEGLVGLTRAFMYAGVPRVVASLWPVEDLATAELMRRFYEGMLGPLKLRPAAALRRAQAQMAGHRRWSAPYYWAAFALQGDWR